VLEARVQRADAGAGRGGDAPTPSGNGERVEALLQDTNHRIGNSLATVSSLLGPAIDAQLSPSKCAQALEAARSRVHAVASAHRRLRLGGDLETAQRRRVSRRRCWRTLRSGRQRSQGGVPLVGEVEPIVISARDATTVGIVVGELVTNAMKHAFPDGRSGTITRAACKRNDEAGVPILVVADDGVGLPEGGVGGESGLGSVIVKQLSNQFGGVPDYSIAPSGGLVVRVSLPGLDGAQPRG
jgi:two-component sensor histidine kinase